MCPPALDTPLDAATMALEASAMARWTTNRIARLVAAPFGAVSLKDEHWVVDLADEKLPDLRGVVVATRPLTDERWTALKEGSLRVFKDGACIYGETRKLTP